MFLISYCREPNLLAVIKEMRGRKTRMFVNVSKGTVC